ncbi:Xaa-Pro aminopeptidase [Porticoccaceae bacterium]|jgi:Xaa-Pro aminopeptidase|nr:Xaa-Pro aminopeptidase [Porticoccaceae bacterium]MDA9014153.1 Xaa-Pro aminopeptidase [Porticoccaceae bacterium]MDA9569594.1 Xaa-Pro aminopeptidase [Porticoccaceae bacterium]
MISKKEYAARRKDLMSMMGHNSVAIIAAAPERVRSKDTYYPYKQSTNLSYLCGFAEPSAVMLLLPNRPQGEFILFCRDKDPLRETWDGHRTGPLQAKNILGADDAFPIDDIEDILPGLLEDKEYVYYSAGKDKAFDSRLMRWVDEVRNNTGKGNSSCDFVDLDHLLGELRLIKSAAEIKLMRKAADISAQAHGRAMRHCSAGQKEYQLQAEIEHEFMVAGASGPAYTSIVGSGANACVLHYIENRATLKSGNLVLIDAGCEYHNYAADITRTFPVNGKFSTAQAAVYDVVLAAQDAAIKTIAPGVTFDKANEAAIAVITQGLIDLGILKGEAESLIANGAYRDFYMHSVSHWLGMDVHDVGDYKVDNQWRVYEAGMLLTIEPGIYISADNSAVDNKWRGIGVRIEDNILVTKNGYEVLTDGVPKQRDQIEKLMA